MRMGDVGDETDILYIGRDPDSPKSTADALEAEDGRFSVSSVRRGQEGLEALSDRDFDCVLADEGVTDVDGTELVDEIRREHRHLPVILLGETDSEDAVRGALAAGATDVLRKPQQASHVALAANRIRNAVARVQAEQAQRRHRKALGTASEGIAIVDSDGTYRYVNTAYADRYGYDREAIIGRRWEVTFPEGEAEFVRDEILPVVEATGRWQGSTKGRRADGTTVCSDTTFARTGGGGFVCTVTDGRRSDSRAAAIRRLHSTARDLVDAESTDEVAEIAVDAATDLLGMPACAIHRYDETTDGLELCARSATADAMVSPRTVIQRGEGIAWEVYESGEPQIHDDVSTDPARLNSDTDVRSHIALPIGDWGVFLLSSKRPDDFDDVDVAAAQILARDVEMAVSRLRKAQRVRTERELLSAQLDATLDGHLVVDADGRVLSYNDQLLDMWGVPEAIVDGGSDTELLDWAAEKLENPATFRRRVNQLYANPDQTSRDELRLLDGRVFETYSAPVEVTTGEYYARLWTFRDVTEQNERERRLDTLLERTSARIYIRDKEGIYKLSNEAHASAVGLEPSEVVGLHATEVLEEASARRSLLSDQHIFATGEPLKTEAVRTIQGSERTFISEKYPYYGSGGEIAGVVAIARDITARKEREEGIRRQNERLKEFASIVSHDLRNPLTVADGQLRLAQGSGSDERIQRALDAINRGEALIDDILSLVRNGDDIGSFETVDLRELSERCWQGVDTGELTFDNETTGAIRADSGRLRQLLENLYRNAAEHGGDRVQMGNIESGFYVEDDGTGIPAEIRDDAFEAGVTTSADGTGFGLRIVEQIATAHGWEITVTEAASGGARFEITGVEYVE